MATADGARGTRTPDLLGAIQALSQLSYSPAAAPARGAAGQSLACWRRVRLPAMGDLEDAIREHLELKRRRGADPAEVAREEQDALAPVTRSHPVVVAQPPPTRDATPPSVRRRTRRRRRSTGRRRRAPSQHEDRARRRRRSSTSSTTSRDARLARRATSQGPGFSRSRLRASRSATDSVVEVVGARRPDVGDDRRGSARARRRSSPTSASIASSDARRAGARRCRISVVSARWSVERSSRSAARASTCQRFARGSSRMRSRSQLQREPAAARK